MNESSPAARVGILVISDRRAAGALDETGPAVAAEVARLLPDAHVTTRIVADEIPAIRDAIEDWCDQGWALVLTAGGTGLGPRDVTPEATKPLIDRPAPGLVVAMIQAGLTSTPYAMLSRPCAGLRGQTLIINLPGSPRGSVESLRAVAPALPHALAVSQAEAGLDGSQRSR